MAGGTDMNVRFIDTSIMLNLLEVPGKCSDKEKVKREWAEVLRAKDTFRQENVGIQRRRKKQHPV